MNNNKCCGSVFDRIMWYYVNHITAQVKLFADCKMKKGENRGQISNTIKKLKRKLKKMHYQDIILSVQIWKWKSGVRFLSMVRLSRGGQGEQWGQKRREGNEDRKHELCSPCTKKWTHLIWKMKSVPRYVSWPPEYWFRSILRCALPESITLMWSGSDGAMPWSFHHRRPILGLIARHRLLWWSGTSICPTQWVGEYSTGLWERVIILKEKNPKIGWRRCHTFTSKITHKR